MEVTFLLHLRLTDVSTLSDEAAAIQDDLESAGHDVISVAPWTRPTTQSISIPTIPLPPPPTEPPSLS